MDLGKTGDCAYYPIGVEIYLDELARAQMCDEQQAAAGIEAGVVEPGVTARQGNSRNDAQAWRYKRGLPGVACARSTPCGQQDQGSGYGKTPQDPGLRRGAAVEAGHRSDSIRVRWHARLRLDR